MYNSDWDSGVVNNVGQNLLPYTINYLLDRYITYKFTFNTNVPGEGNWSQWADQFIMPALPNHVQYLPPINNMISRGNKVYILHFSENNVKCNWETDKSYMNIYELIM